MDKLQLSRPWEEVKEMLKEINGSLTDEDLVYKVGEEEALLTKLSRKINMSPSRVKDLIESVSFTDGKAS